VNRLPLLAALVLPALAASCVTKAEYEKVRNARDAAESKYRELAQYQVDLESENRRLRNENELLEQAATDRRGAYKDARAVQDEYERKLAELRQRLEAIGSSAIVGGGGGDVEVYQTHEGTVVDIKDGVLFNSGSAEILAKGKELLDHLAAEFAKSDYKLRVDGHTDTDPVVRSKDKFPLGNLQLSAARAIAVADYLSHKSKTPIEEGRISVSGFGQYQPRAAGNSPEAKRKNRRVDIVLLRAPAGSIEPKAVEDAASK